MNEFLKMDIFFFVTTVAVILLAGCATLVTWRITRILQHIEHISEQISRESDSIRADLAEVRADIRKGKGKLQSLFNFFGTRVKRSANKK